MKSRISRIEAKYTAYQWANSWVSEAAETNYNSDFYSEIREAGLLDKSKLDETNGFDDKITLFIPNEDEIRIIKEEMIKLSDKLFKEMAKCKRTYWVKIKKKKEKIKK